MKCREVGENCLMRSFLSSIVRQVQRVFLTLLTGSRITFGMKGSVDRLTALCFTAMGAVHAWEFVYDLSAVVSSYQLH
jgi:hypothetical protein